MQKPPSNRSSRRRRPSPPPKSNVHQQNSPKEMSPVVIPDDDIDQFRPTEEQGYYHGVIPRADVNSILSENGDFLVRKTNNTDGKPVISVKWKNKIQHYTITCNNGKYRMPTTKQTYDTLQELVFDYYVNKKPFTERTGAILKEPKKLEAWEVTEDKVNWCKKIGKGNFGDVYLGKMMHNNVEIPIAIKMSNKKEMKPSERERFMEEVRTMRRYHHPNIVQFRGVTITKDPMMILMEYVDGGSLIDFLLSTEQQKPTSLKIRIMLQASRGMEYLASQRCIHRDLAARNCLVTKATKCVKIADFGLSRHGSEYQIQSKTPIPIKWTAPEVFIDFTFTHKSDIWSFGILSWEIFNDGETPYSNFEKTPDKPIPRQIVEFLQQGQRLSTTKMPPIVGKLVRSCWMAEPNERPTFKQCKDILTKIVQ